VSATTISARERLPLTRKVPLSDVRASLTLASAATFVLEEAQSLKDVRSISRNSSMRGEALVSDDDSPMSEMLAFTAPPQSNNRLIARTKAESRSAENGRYTYLPFEQQRIWRGKLFVTYFTPSFLVSFKLACSRRFSKVFRRLCCRPKKESGESTSIGEEFVLREVSEEKHKVYDTKASELECVEDGVQPLVIGQKVTKEADFTPIVMHNN
jgi:hypothetical protein